MHCNYAAVKEFAIRLLRDGQVNGRLIGGLRRLVRDGEGWHARNQVSLAVVMARDSLQSPFYERIQAGEVRGSAARRRFLPKSVHRKMTSEIYREIIAGEHDDDARLSFAEFLTAQKNDAIAQALLLQQYGHLPIIRGHSPPSHGCGPGPRGRALWSSDLRSGANNARSYSRVRLIYSRAASPQPS